ncbi:5816_t:CDS:2, partial [Paraglomus brasilianum]
HSSPRQSLSIIDYIHHPYVETFPAPSPKPLQLFNNHYNQFPCLPCIYCGQLLYPEKAAWVVQEDLSTYALFQLYPSISLDDIAHPSTANFRLAIVAIWEDQQILMHTEYRSIVAIPLLPTDPYLHSYSTLANRLLQINDTLEMFVWPTAFPISQDDSVTSFQHNNVVVPNFDFAEE